MFKKIILSIFYLILSEGILLSQTDVFYKLYDYNNQYDGTFSIIQTSDNYYIIAGGTYNDTIPSDALFIIKINNKGDTIWETIIDPNPQGDNASCVVETTSHNFIISGTTKDSLGIKADLFLMNVTNNGLINWFKRYGGTNNDYNEKVILTNDGGYLLAGSTLSNTIGYEDAYLVKTDSLGNQQWAKQYGGTNADVFNSVIQTSDGGFAAVGYSYSYGTYNQIYLVKTDSAGNLQWYKTFAYEQGAGASDLKQTTDSGFIIAADFYVSATDQTDAYLLKTDSLGIMQWDKVYSLGNETEYFHTVYLSQNGYNLAGGTYDYSLSTPKPRGWLIKADSNGDTLWTKTYTYYGGNTSDYLYDMQPTSDGGFVLSGMIINNPLPYKNDIFVIKTDSLGNTCVPISTSHDGCWDTITLIPNSKLQTPNSRVLIYPNPVTQGKLSIEYDFVNKKNLDFIISDITGKTLKHYKLDPKNNLLKIENLNLPSGIYYFKLKDRYTLNFNGKIIIIY